MKKPTKKPAAKAAPAKKAVPVKKAPVKAVPKKAAPVAKKAAPVKKAVAAKKVPVKVVSKKIPAAASKKIAAKSKTQIGLQKKIQDKIASNKKANADKVSKKIQDKTPKKVVEEKKKQIKVLEVQKNVDKATKEKAAKEKLPLKIQKESNKETVRKAKLEDKEAALTSKKLTKEKEDVKTKGRKGTDLDDEELGEDGQPIKRRSIEDDEDDDDIETLAPKKVKMIFDEDIEEEIIPVRKKKSSSMDDDIKENLAEEIIALSEDFSIEDVFASIRSMDLFKVETDECVVRGCDNPATTSGYCRYHYIKLWKDVKKKQLILSEGRLAKIIEELVRKYPMKYIETIIQDLADDKAFNHVLKDLDIETDAEEIDGFDDDELLDDDQDIAFETKVVKPSFDD